ncbi:hypothetical protein AAFC00_007312 [Neodothiora populina]|uniref:Uncharacterized protein n=1 Tax=Neodothiora populina TaxID=2781224 RepID=A0ABR3PHV5_9PEZI
MGSRNIITQDELFERLQSRFPQPESDSPTLASGQFALDRRTASRRGSPLHGRHQAASPPLTDHGSRVSSPLSPTWKDGARSTASSPGPSRPAAGARRGPPPALRIKRSRPTSELFLPTPTDPNKRMTIFRLPSTVAQGTQKTMSNELFLPDPSGPIGKAAEDAVDEPASPEEPPLSPISAALSKARFSRLDVPSSVRRVIKNVNVITEHPAVFHALGTATPMLAMERAATVPLPRQRPLSSATVKTFRSVPIRVSSNRTGGGRSATYARRPLTEMLKKRGARFSGIDKDLAATKRATALTIKQKSTNISVSVPDSPDQPKQNIQGRPAPSFLPWRRKRKGETMSMLLDAGFFPVNEYIYNKDAGNPQKGHMSKKRKALSIMIKDLPASPFSIVGTPTGFYDRVPLSPRRHIRASGRRSLMSRRRVLGQLKSPVTPLAPLSLPSVDLTSTSPLSVEPATPSGPAGALFTLTGQPASPISPPEISPGVLEVIHEDGTVSEDFQDAPVDNDDDLALITEEPEDIAPDVPIRTEIHLTSGTVLTVNPPELSSWTQSIYIPGPIKLQAPDILAVRKDSIASLAPFQSAVDDIYDQALKVPRRASESQAVEDVLDWYDDWGFGLPSFAHDALAGRDGIDPHELDENSLPTPVDKETSSHISGLEHHFADGRRDEKPTIPPRNLPSDTIEPSSHTSAPSSHRRTSSAATPHHISILSTLSPVSENTPTPRTTNTTSSISPPSENKAAIPTAKPDRKHSTPQWIDSDDESENSDNNVSSLPHWLLPSSHSHSGVREIAGSRKPSGGKGDETGMITEKTNISAGELSSAAGHRAQGKKRKSHGRGFGYRRFVAGSAGTRFQRS